MNNVPVSRSNNGFTINSRELSEILTRVNGTDNLIRHRYRLEETAEGWHPPLVLPPDPPEDNGDR